MVRHKVKLGVKSPPPATVAGAAAQPVKPKEMDNVADLFANNDEVSMSSSDDDDSDSSDVEVTKSTTAPSKKTARVAEIEQCGPEQKKQRTAEADDELCVHESIPQFQLAQPSATKADGKTGQMDRLRALKTSLYNLKDTPKVVAEESESEEEEEITITAVSAAPAAEPEGTQVKLRLRIDKETFVEYRQLADHSFERMHAAFCTKHKLSPSSVSFILDGEAIDLTETPNDLDLEDLDVIDIRK